MEMVRAETPGIVACEVCLKEIPRSVTQSQEGADYVYHFCGDACYQEWRATRDMREIGVTISGLALEFATAQELAEALLSRRHKEAMLIAWFDRARGMESPQVPECTSKPGWLAYAESHGGNIQVTVNNGEYVFIFARPAER